MLCTGRSSLDGRFACEDRLAAMTYVDTEYFNVIEGQQWTLGILSS